MKKLIAFLFTITMMISQAEKIELLEMPSGKVYKSVTITAHDDAWLEIMHASGATRLKLADCSEELQLKYGYNKDKAAALITKERLGDNMARKAEAARLKTHEEKQSSIIASRPEKEEAPKKTADASKLKELMDNSYYLAAVIKTPYKKGQPILCSMGVVDETGYNKNGDIKYKFKGNKFTALLTGTNLIEGKNAWAGRGWKLGMITVGNGVSKATVRHYTASRTEAQAYYTKMLKR